VPSPASPPAELFRSLVQVLHETGASWYVFGAQAVLLWGRPRFTADIDVTVRLDTLAPVDFATSMERAGFALRVSADDDFVKRTRVLPFVHAPTGWLLDVVLAGPGLEDMFIDRAVDVDLGDGVHVPVIRAEDLIVTKLLASRSKDIDDVRGILLERLDKLDVASIRETLGLLEEALGVSDLLTALDAELRWVRRHR
jgi:Nucleotidyl transferase of unknown function (DUF2204)